MSWQRIASIDEARRARPWLGVRVADVEVAVAALGDAWFAVEDRCSHAGCPFSEEASLEDGTIVCNCHGSEFDLRTGDVRRGPAEYAVRAFPVRAVGDSLEVDL